MRNIGSLLLLILLVIAVSSGFAGVYYFTQAETQRTELQDLRLEVKELRARLKEPRETSTTQPQAETVSDPPDEKVSKSGFMVVTSPVDGEQIGTSVEVSGRAIAFEATVNIRVMDASSNVLHELSAMTDAEDAGLFGDFSAGLSFNAPDTATGTIEVFEHSARDGSEINKVIVPIGFQD